MKTLELQLHNTLLSSLQTMNTPLRKRPLNRHQRQFSPHSGVFTASSQNEQESMSCFVFSAFLPPLINLLAAPKARLRVRSIRSKILPVLASVEAEKQASCLCLMLGRFCQKGKARCTCVGCPRGVGRQKMASEHPSDCVWADNFKGDIHS